MQVIVFTGGGTGGHVYPGLAVLQALRDTLEERPARFVWIGSEKGIERSIIEGLGIEYRAISTGKLRRYFDWKNFTDVFRIVLGFFQARRILKELRPAFVFSKGGFVSVPPVRAARGLKIPVYSHESDLDPGLATRLNWSASRLVFCPYQESVDHFPVEGRAKVRVTGNPVRHELSQGNPTWIRTKWTVPEAVPVLLVLGGSLGARQVNELVAATLPSWAGKYFVVHQTGNEWTAIPDSSWYVSRPFFSTEMPDLYAGATVVLGRSGAGTLWEAALTAKPLVLLPLGAGSRGDQVRNAELFARRKSAIVLGPDPTPEQLDDAVSKWVNDPEAYQNAAESLRAMGADRAARTIVEHILRDLEESGSRV